MKDKTILFAISSLGLGHATRTLPIIKHFLIKKNKIIIVSTSKALELLKKDLKKYKNNNNIIFYNLKDYPKLERGNGIMFYVYLILDIINTNWTILKERKFVKDIEKQVDFFFSDGRYGFYSKTKPSFILSHQISFIMPKGLKIFQKLADYFNKKIFQKFDKLFIPDFEDNSKNLAGSLSHTTFLHEINHTYIGILSSLKKNPSNKKNQYLFTISGYLEENKESFIKNLLNQSKDLKGEKIFILGDTNQNYIKKDKKHNITILAHAFGKKRQKLFNEAEIVISRSGYTTIMDLTEIDKKAILFPTPNQTEQEYLADYYKQTGYFVIGNNNHFSLKDLVKQTKNNKIVNFKNKTKESLEKIEKELIKHLNVKN